jgi:release factor glutamine methyltransferase
VSTAGDLLADAAAKLTLAGIEDARREGRMILAHALGLDVAAIFGRPERAVSPEEAETFASLVARRAAREPWSRILGVREFWSLPFQLTQDTLDPRPDSETLVRAVLDALPDHQAPLRLLDLGTGSGCLLLALLSELPAAWGLGVDLSPGAAEAAQANARALGFGRRAAFLAGDWAWSLVGAFDAIVVNPPYIAAADIAGLEPEVARWDPVRALAGGADGLDSIRALMPEIARLLAPGGLAAVELGAGQADAANTIAMASGLAVFARPTDLHNVERCLLMRLAGSGPAKNS